MKYLKAAETLRDNPGQWRAYTSKGNCVILAGPGSGKTRVVAVKVAQLLAEVVRSPRGLACVTYNNECARELRSRLDQLGVEDSRRLCVGTLHSFCLGQILIPYAHLTDVDVPESIGVATRQDVIRILGDALESLGIRANPSDHIWSLNKFRRESISRASGSGWVPGDKGDTDLTLEYERRLVAEGLLDFEAMITKAYQVVARHPWVRRCLTAKYPVFVVDEYQDLGVPLHEMVLRLVFDGGMRLIAVGDPDQSIYGFQGAKPELLRVLAARDEVECVTLRLNYRSAPKIVRASQFALAEDRDFVAHHSHHGHLEFHPIDGTFSAQARYIAEDLIPPIVADHQPGEVVILFPSKYQGDDLEVALQGGAYEYVRLGPNTGYPRGPYTRLVEDLARWVSGGWRTGDPRLSRLLVRWTNVLGVSHPAERRGYQLPLVRFLFRTRDTASTAATWVEDLDTSVLQYDDVSQRLADAGQYTDHEILVEALAPGGKLSSFSVANLAGQAGSPDHLNLVTLHSSKGSEFRVVIIAGADAGKLPNQHARSEAQRAEARRLFYVAVSRAKDAVHIVFSNRIPGDRYHAGPSPFVVELQQKLRENEDATASAAATVVAGGPVWDECPQCGAAADQLKGSQSEDEERDDLYWEVRCMACGWETGGEM